MGSISSTGRPVRKGTGRTDTNCRDLYGRNETNIDRKFMERILSGVSHAGHIGGWGGIRASPAPQGPGDLAPGVGLGHLHQRAQHRPSATSSHGPAL